jgi:hypothetical protein
MIEMTISESAAIAHAFARDARSVISHGLRRGNDYGRALLNQNRQPADATVSQ